MNSILSKARKAIEQLLDRGTNADGDWLYDRRTFYDTNQVHGFYRLVTPSGKFLQHRHHCAVSGDWAVEDRKGAVVVHCTDRRQSVFDPEAPMPTVVRYPRAAAGTVRFADGSVALDSTSGEWDGDVGYDRSTPGGMF